MTTHKIDGSQWGFQLTGFKALSSLNLFQPITDYHVLEKHISLHSLFTVHETLVKPVKTVLIVYLRANTVVLYISINIKNKMVHTDRVFD